MKPLDMHVHVVGNGTGGTGCSLCLRGVRRPLARVMLRGIGLPGSSLHGDLDRLYVERLLELIRGSSLGAAVIFAQDLVHDDSGWPLPEASLFYVPNDYVLGLAAKHPEFLPAVSIHPARADVFDELEKCLAGGAVAMKCLPNCHNINCNDRKYVRFWERMAEAGLPLIAHTGGEHTLPIVRREYADPRILALPLECGVTVIAAHCATRSGLFDPDYFHVLEGLTRRFANLYADTSAFNLPFRSRHIRDCLRGPLLERLVHGSDFPVPVNGHWAWLRGHLGWQTFRDWEKSPNPLERDYQFKVAMGFPPASFTRAWRLLRVKREMIPAAAEAGQKKPG